MMMTKQTLRTWMTVLALGIATPVLVVGCGSTPTRESPGQFVDDATITTKVKAAFVADKTVSALNIAVETYKGTVQLSGFAKSQDEINQAVALARGVTGVQAVKNSIQLKAAQ